MFAMLIAQVINSLHLKMCKICLHIFLLSIHHIYHLYGIYDSWFKIWVNSISLDLVLIPMGFLSCEYQNFEQH
jgi:hypothetical protein